MASESVFVPEDGAHGVPVSQPITIDTEAALVTSEPVMASARSALHTSASPSELADAVEVTATPNTRILHIRFRWQGAKAATTGVEAIVDTYASMRRAQIVSSRASDLSTLMTRSDQLGDELLAARTVLLAAETAQNRRLAKKVGGLRHQSRLTSVAIARISSQDVEGPQVVQAATVKQPTDGWTVSITAGATLALVLGLVGCSYLDGQNRRMGRRKLGGRSDVDLPVLARVAALETSASPAEVSAQLRTARSVLQAYSPLSAVLAIPGSSSSRKIALTLDASLPVTLSPAGPRVLIVASTTTRTREVARMDSSLRLSGQQVVGIVLVLP